MPGLALPAREAADYGHLQSADQMCRQQSRSRLSPDEQLAAEESFALYCKPVELYNIIQRRAIKNPSFMQRCLHYKIHASRKKRIQITVSLSQGANTEWPEHNVFPLYVLLATPTTNISLEGHSPIYRFSRACLLTSFSESGNEDHTKATFTIPDVKNLTTSRACNLSIILIKCVSEGQVEENFGKSNCTGDHVEGSALQSKQGSALKNISIARASVDPAHSLHGSNLSPPTVLQFGKTRKLSAERADPRNRQLLQKRQFFHSHRAQPMAVEQVFSDRDSEDEVDDDIADFEDRRMLDDFVDVTKDEKLIMHMWNSFVRKQRVLADGHIPWACEAFSRLHGQQLVQNTPLLWCWRFLMIKLWNHSLLDARAMNTCNTILEGYQKESLDPKKN